MPIYEYKCDGCGHALEAIQKFSEEPLAICPACGLPKLKKLISAGGFQLKGSGWYATDFKNSGKKKSEPTPASGGETPAVKPEKKTHGCGSGGCGCG